MNSEEKGKVALLPLSKTGHSVNVISHLMAVIYDDLTGIPTSQPNVPHMIECAERIYLRVEGLRLSGDDVPPPYGSWTLVSVGHKGYDQREAAHFAYRAKECLNVAKKFFAICEKSKLHDPNRGQNYTASSEAVVESLYWAIFAQYVSEKPNNRWVIYLASVILGLGNFKPKEDLDFRPLQRAKDLIVSAF